jgi:hypothetical protein
MPEPVECSNVLQGRPLPFTRRLVGLVIFRFAKDVRKYIFSPEKNYIERFAGLLVELIFSKKYSPIEYSDPGNL